MRKMNISLGILTLFVFFVSCDDCGSYLPGLTAVGYVIGKENCHIDKNEDYWLISIVSSASGRQEYGSPLVVDNILYNNVVKVSGLPDQLKAIGGKVGIDFTIDETAFLTTGCDIPSPVVYKLKLVHVLRGGHAVF